MNNPSWALEKVRGWSETNTNSLSPAFKECLQVTVALAEEALRLAAALAEIQSIKKAE